MRPARSDKTAGCDQCVLAKVVPDSPADAVTLGLVTDVRAMASLALIGAGSNRDLQDFALDIINRLKGL